MSWGGQKITLPPSGLPDAETKASAEQQASYLRRMNRTGMPVRVQRWSSVITSLSATCLVGYSIFFADFGPHEHVFSPARRWLDRQRRSFWTLSEEDKRIAASQLQPSTIPSPPPPPST